MEKIESLSTDYQPVNTAIEHEASRHRALLQVRWSAVLINWAIVFAIISVSILVLVLSYKLFGVDSIWSKEKEIESQLKVK